MECPNRSTAKLVQDQISVLHWFRKV